MDHIEDRLASLAVGMVLGFALTLLVEWLWPSMEGLW